MRALNLLFSPSSKTQPIGMINLDWLGFSVTLLENAKERDAHAWIFHEPDGYRLVELQGTNIYKRRLILYSSDGSKMLTILCEPHSRIINRNAALIEVANEWLYYGFSWVMMCLYDIHPCTFLCLSRLDLACDFPISENQRKLICDLSTNSAYVAGKRDGSAFYSYTSEDSGIERTPRCLSWGSKCSNIKWKVYNKSAEIYEPTKDGKLECHKPYIANEWRRVDWDTQKIWRCEVSITPAGKFQHYGRRLGWNAVINGFEMTDLFVSLYMTRFVIRINQGHRDKSNDKRVHLLEDMGQVERVTQWINPHPDELCVSEYTDCLNVAMFQLTKPEVLTNVNMRQLWIDTATKCVELGRLQMYFFDKYKYNYLNISERNSVEVLFSPSS